MIKSKLSNDSLAAAQALCDELAAALVLIEKIEGAPVISDKPIQKLYQTDTILTDLEALKGMGIKSIRIDQVGQYTGVELAENNTISFGDFLKEAKK